MIRICFVCLGNICRSPTAEGVMAHLVERANLGREITIDSAGTGDWHVGDPPDRRAAAVARGRGIDLRGRARQFKPGDFAERDYVVAMDRSNFDDLARMAPSEAARAKIHMLRAFDPATPDGPDVPDPYYGGERGFEEVLDLCQKACGGLLELLRVRHALR